MSAIERTLDLYHMLYMVCGVIGIVMLCLAILMFFIFKIYRIIMEMTGISRRKEIHRMENNSKFTSQLERKSAQNSGRTGRIGRTGHIGGLRKVVIEPPKAETGGTRYQSEQTAPQPERNTGVLDEGMKGDTQLLSEKMTVSMPDRKVPQTTATQPEGRYFVKVTRTIMLVHTNEEI